MLVSELKEQLSHLNDSDEIAVAWFSKDELDPDENLCDTCWFELVHDAKSDMEEMAKEALEANLSMSSDPCCSCVVCNKENCECDARTDAYREASLGV